jgi:hypothetical protein
MTKHHDYFPLPKLSSRLMRQMRPGDVIYVDAGHRVRTQKNLYQNQVNASARAKLLKMEIGSRVMYLFDPKDPDNFNMEPIVAIYCKTVAAPLGKRGRRAKEIVEVPESDVVPPGNT